MVVALKRWFKRALSRAYFWPFLRRRRRLAARDPRPFIDPDDVIRRHGIGELLGTAEAYFARLDPKSRAALKERPFDSLLSAPDTLYRLGLLLSGLKLGRGMRVLDFGAGSCWLSHALARLGLQTIALDASTTALALGRELFAERPVTTADPAFSLFDGRHFDLPDASVDRIICFDAFHHVANPGEVMNEMYRVLADGGIAGFSEPGRAHARTAQSQYEMRNFTVLERDIRIEEMRELAAAAGFGRFYAKPLILLGYELEWQELHDTVLGQRVSPELLTAILDTMHDNATIFFLQKGRYEADSRTAEGLASAIEAPARVVARAGVDVELPILVTNRGSARWLARPANDIGMVRLGAHLHRGAELIDHEFLRVDLAADVAPGESARLVATTRFPAVGRFQLVFDCVAEGVCWFESVGGVVARVEVDVS